MVQWKFPNLKVTLTDVLFELCTGNDKAFKNDDDTQLFILSSTV